MKKKKILVALSGGVDSALSAKLLVDAGYSVTGMFAIDYEGKGESEEKCWLADYRDAVRVAAHIGIPIVRWNFTDEYRDLVLSRMYHEYEQGVTPNPDVWCNTSIKFGVWLKKAISLGFDALATGHYADVQYDAKTKKYELHIPKDTEKDQTYFLHQLNQDQLRHALFPLAPYTKKQVRVLAKKYDLPVAQKSESMGICFVGEVDMKDFLSEKITKKPGRIVTTDGKYMGMHDGLAFYTVGQRHGLSWQGGKEPLFVVQKKIKENELVVGFPNDPLAYKKQSLIETVHWISGEPPAFPANLTVRLRHRHPLVWCTLTKNKKGHSAVTYKKPERAVTPGQFAVFYKDGLCLGGGAVSVE